MSGLLSPTDPELRDSWHLPDHASLPLTPPRAWHRASTWGSVDTQGTAWAPSPSSPEPLPPPCALPGDFLSFTRVESCPWGLPAHETKGFVPPGPSLQPSAGALLPGRCLGCEKYHSCFCSGHDLGEKEKKVHQGKPSSHRSFPLDAYTCLSRLHNPKRTTPQSCSPPE